MSFILHKILEKTAIYVIIHMLKVSGIMEESYLDIDIREIVEKVENGADLNFLAKYYGFPSTTILRNVLKKFYKEAFHKHIPKKVPISEEIKEEIFNYYYQGHSIEDISNKYYLNTYHVNNILTEMRSKHGVKKPEINIENVISDVESGLSLQEISEKNGTTKATIINHLKSCERGQKVLERFKKPPKEPKPEMTAEEIEEAYLSGDMEKLQHIRNWRSILQDKYGLEYMKVLKQKKGIVPKKEKHQKVLSKNQFETSLKSFPLETLIKEANKRGIIVPEEYIKEYESKSQTDNPSNKLETPNDDDGWVI